MDQLYLDNIDEYVQDQDKIVTYKWLSLTLGVHVNTAKQMLFHYLENKRKEGCSALHATFLLSGKSEDHGQTSHKVSLVREEELEEAKARLSSVVSVHVYSIHKALLRDSSPLFGVDYDAARSSTQRCNRFSAIHCPDAVPRSKTPQHPPPAPPAHQTNSEAPPTAKTASKPKGIMGIFKTKSETKQETESRPESKTESKAEPVGQPVTKVSKPGPKTSPSANFFGTQTKKPVQEVKVEMSSPSTASTEPRPLQADRDSRSKSKRLESDDEEEPQEKKKRRRIRKPQSDSSDDEVIPDPAPQTERLSPDPRVQAEEEEEEQAKEEDGATQTENPTMKTRKRRRVLRSKTFLDDEGCMVTEKVYESESYSEDEEVQTKPGLNSDPKPALVRPQASEKKKRGAPAAKSGAKTTKQASITGFFTKK